MASRIRSGSTLVRGDARSGPDAGGTADGAPGLLRTSAALLAEALASDDAEAGGLRADDVLADPEQALSVLGAPDGWVAARHAVVQRYGRVGALMVLAYEQRWALRHSVSTGRAPTRGRAGRGRADDGHVRRCLDALLETFGDVDAVELDELLADLERAGGAGAGGEEAEARRWLHATYAVAARDRTDAAHRAYMEALDRVLRLASPRIAS